MKDESGGSRTIRSLSWTVLPCAAISIWAASQTPMRRVPPPEELAAAALWLATDDASHMTGNFIMCDGGYSMIGA